ncbi:DUF2946 family protein [Methylocystis heyeri]|uniref:DUF2946 domain-containing protein n=1 Tax=Methylocystis heyeri TaxID=391905 RepID=A0A6B8KGS8_9HYPH|nr:DUF2946 family protein [Methylocystis heyeri]QGM46832.1 DUF2946 domain-containing protein [Methylocystis heyeri]
MSQGSEKRVGLRAIFAVTAVCALILSLFVSGAMQGAHAETPADAVVAQSAPCPLMSAGDHSAAGHNKSGHSGKVDCPFCCLAAHAGAAVLPDRIGSAVRPPKIASSPVVYFALFIRDPQTAISNAVNAARAPPAILSLS